MRLVFQQYCFVQELLRFFPQSLLCIDPEELTVSKEKVIEIEVGRTDNTPVRHPKSSNGYYFVNGILLHD